MQDAVRHPYLENERALPASLLASERFAGCIRTDSRGNAVFPHFDGEGLCGFEIKNKGFTGFSTGGAKGLFMSNIEPGDNRLVFCESGIDALSYAALFPDERTRYASIGGKPSPMQRELIRSAAARHAAVEHGDRRHGQRRRRGRNRRNRARGGEAQRALRSAV